MLFSLVFKLIRISIRQEVTMTEKELGSELKKNTPFKIGQIKLESGWSAVWTLSHFLMSPS